MLAWTLASATADNAHARMEPGGEPCLENAHARVEGAGSDGAHSERPLSKAMPMLVSILGRQLFGRVGATLTHSTESRAVPTLAGESLDNPKDESFEN